jgi:hypothetical protein
MVYVIAKKIKGKEYYYAYACRRVDGKPKSVFVEYFGRNKPDKEKLEELRRKYPLVD